MVQVGHKNGIGMLGAVLAFCINFAWGNAWGGGVEPIWKRYIVASRHFSVQSPYPFVESAPAGKEGQVMFQNSPQIGNTQILIVVTRRPGKMALADIPGEVLSSLEKREGYSDFESRFKKTTCSNVPAILTRRNFKKNGNVSMTVEELDAVKKETWFCVMVFHDSGNRELDRMADQVIHSFKILN